MTDIVSPAIRSRMMAGIPSRDTKPELAVRKGLHRLGLRFRLGWKYRRGGRLLPGKPDLILPARRAVIFVHGCFWHGHDCSLFHWPATEEVRWRDKLSNNILRDRRVRDELLADGWRVLDVWECTLKGRDRMPLDQLLAQCQQFVLSNRQFDSLGKDQTVVG